MKFGGAAVAGALGWLAMAGFVGAQEQREPQVVADTDANGLPVKSEPTPRVFYSGRGQFEIVVLDVSDAQQALALGRTVWDALSGTLGLPAEGFPQPVSVRFVPAEQWSEPAVFTVTVEPPGRVNVRVRWSAETDPMDVRRAFVQGIILRQAAGWHGVNPKLTVPLWLEQACTHLSLARERPSMLDLFQQESAAIAPTPPLRGILTWERDAVESRDWELASLWLLLQLQAEASAEPARWGGWLRGVVGGADPIMTLPQSYAGLWTSLADMELWWQVGFQHQRGLRTLPVMTAEASRFWLADRSRWLAGRGGREVVLSLAELRELRDEPWVRAELVSRRAQARSVLGAVHPFYANTVLSLGKLYEAALKGGAKPFEAARAEFERDALDARELEDTVNAILDTAPRK